MTRKHFEAIAAILQRDKASHELIIHMADYLGTTNPNFDRFRFITACKGKAVAA